MHFKVNDGQADSQESAAVTLGVTPVNDAPTGVEPIYDWVEDYYAGPPGGVPMDLGATGLDVETYTGQLTAEIVEQPLAAEGSLYEEAGRFYFFPAADFNGNSTFKYQIVDTGDPAGTLADVKRSVVLTATVRVSEVNDAPVLTDDAVTATQDEELTFDAWDLLLNDAAGPANESGQTLTVTDVVDLGDAHGTVSFDGTDIVYTPEPGFHGTASFVYYATDNGTTNGAADPQSDSGIITVTVEEATAEAGSLVVTTSDDSSTATDGVTSLKEAIAYANSNPGPDAITFSPTAFAAHETIVITGNYVLEEDVTITAPAAGVTISGTRSQYDFIVQTGVKATLKSLTIIGGARGVSLGDGGEVEIIACTLTDNDDAVNAGASKVTITNSTLALNTASALYGGNDTHITNCTIASNSYGLITDNLVLTNSLVVGSTFYEAVYGPSNTVSPECIVGGSLEDVGLEVDPDTGRAALKDNGGPTKTIALVGGAAVDAGDNGNATGLATDQRGSGYNRIRNGTVDLGAFEMQSGAGALKFRPSQKTF